MLFLPVSRQGLPSLFPPKGGNRRAAFHYRYSGKQRREDEIARRVHMDPEAIAGAERPGSTCIESKKLAVELALPNAEHCTLKCFRKGHASELAAHGATLHIILGLGEWRSAGFLAYVHADAAELQRLIASRFDESDED